MKRALVTGAAGFLGRHFARELRTRGWTVTGVDPKANRGTPWTVAWDCRDLFEEADLDHYDLVVHCAAVIGGREVIDGNPLATAVNLELDAAMFRWAAVARPGRVLYISSSAVYPVSLQGGGLWTQRLSEPLRDLGSELDQGSPDQVYGWTKLVGEVLAGKLRDAGVPVTVVRPFSGYGEDQSLDYPFPSFIARAARRDDPFVVWGDGEQVRDFVHVDDVVAGALEAVENELGGPFNLGTGRPTSFNELARLVCAEAGYSPALEHREAKPTGVRYRVADTSLMDRVYVPKVSLEEGIRRVLDTGARLLI